MTFGTGTGSTGNYVINNSQTVTSRTMYALNFSEIPSTDGRGAFQDPTHVSYWNENSFLYYTDKYLGDFIDNDTIRFQEFRKQTYYPNDWMKNLQVLVTTAWLVAAKDDGIRYPHKLQI